MEFFDVRGKARIDRHLGVGDAAGVEPDRQGLLRDITQVLAAERVNVTSINTKSDPTDHTATMSLSMDIGSLAGLGDVLARINQLSNVIEVRRSHQGYSDEQSRH